MAMADEAVPEPRWSIGLRRGFSATSYDDPFHQTDVFASWDLPPRQPWRFESESRWYLQSRLIGSGGWLSGQNEGGFVGTMGVSFVGGQLDFPLRADVGFSPTLLTRDEFGTTDFGMPLQFTSYGGLYLRFQRHFWAGYRFQHMSNASLKPENSGLDLHVVGISYHF